MLDITDIKYTTKNLDMEHPAQPCLAFKLADNPIKEYYLYLNTYGLFDIVDSTGMKYINASSGNIGFICNPLIEFPQKLSDVQTNILYHYMFLYFIDFIRMALDSTEIHYCSKFDNRLTDVTLGTNSANFCKFIFMIFKFLGIEIQEKQIVLQEFSHSLLSSDDLVEILEIKNNGIKVYISCENYNIILKNVSGKILNSVCLFGIDTTTASTLLTYIKVYLLNKSYYLTVLIYLAVQHCFALQGIILSNENNTVVYNAIETFFKE